ncbi:hypothetical protein [Mobilicoccus massiliensis]|uniref:hypothetical protein n=1 Tax=Mobilicoccus massiliensis TaxID=1522310 RepID=UPI00058E713F|nr:hypothetical protein [Mobilicoccus massiliensis]
MTAHRAAPADPLALSEVAEAEDRVAVGGEIVPTHVRYVLAFNRRPTEDELAVVAESLGRFDVVRGVSADGVEVVTANRDEPGKQLAHLKDAVAGATEEAARRAAAREEQAGEAEGLREDLEQRLVDGA